MDRHADKSARDDRKGGVSRDDRKMDSRKSKQRKKSRFLNTPLDSRIEKTKAQQF